LTLRLAQRVSDHCSLAFYKNNLVLSKYYGEYNVQLIGKLKTFVKIKVKKSASSPKTILNKRNEQCNQLKSY